MNKYLLLLIFCVSTNCLLAQAPKEFEGIIKYKHSYNFDNYNGDTLEVKKALGISSVFFYKDGNYKWVIEAETRIVEHFDAKTQTVYSFYGKDDTLLMSAENGHDDTVSISQVDDNEYLIGNILCKKIETVSSKRNDPDLVIKRVLYYSDRISLLPGRFAGYRSYGSNRVFSLIKSWPLRIELSVDIAPYIFIIEADEVVPMKLKDEDVRMPTGKPIKPLSLL